PEPHDRLAADHIRRRGRDAHGSPVWTTPGAPTVHGRSHCPRAARVTRPEHRPATGPVSAGARGRADCGGAGAGVLGAPVRPDLPKPPGVRTRLRTETAAW